MIVKICGLTRKKDALAAASLGAQMLGFISIPRSKRFLETGKIGQLVKKLGASRKSASTVLVLEPVSCEEALEKMKATGADAVQLYSLSPSQAASLGGKGFLVFRAIAIPFGAKKLPAGKIKEIIGFSKVCDGIFFDASVSGKAGGTGKKLSFAVLQDAAAIAKKANKKTEVFLSGGMDAARLEELASCKKLLGLIDGIDASSGVESAPGKKDLGKLSKFVPLARELD